MSIDFEFADPMAQEIFSAISHTYDAMRKYRGVALKDNYHLAECEESLRQALAHLELGAGHWKRGAGAGRGQ